MSVHDDNDAKREHGADALNHNLNGANPYNPDAPEPDPALVELRRRFFDAPSVDELLATDPPPRRWVIQDLVPAGVAGMLIGQGGVGKGMLELLVGIRIACGFDIGSFRTARGRVLIVSREDDREELHRRLVATVRAIDPHFGADTLWRADVVENLHLVDLVGVPGVGLTETLIDAIVAKVDAIASTSSSWIPSTGSSPMAA